MSQLVLREGDLERMAENLQVLTRRPNVTLCLSPSTYDLIVVNGITVPADVRVVDREGNVLRERLT